MWNKKINIYQEAAEIETYFYPPNSRLLKNLAKLTDQLANKDEELSIHCVNLNNDFISQILKVFGAEDLARRMSMPPSAQGLLKSII